jgi:hypothetical protein
MNENGAFRKPLWKVETFENGGVSDVRKRRCIVDVRKRMLLKTRMLRSRHTGRDSTTRRDFLVFES